MTHHFCCSAAIPGSKPVRVCGEFREAASPFQRQLEVGNFQHFPTLFWWIVVHFKCWDWSSCTAPPNSILREDKLLTICCSEMLRGSGSFDQHPTSIFSSTFGDVALDASAASARSTGTRVEASGNWQLQDWDEPIGANVAAHEKT